MYIENYGISRFRGPVHARQISVNAPFNCLPAAFCVPLRRDPLPKIEFLSFLPPTDRTRTCLPLWHLLFMK